MTYTEIVTQFTHIIREVCWSARYVANINHLVGPNLGECNGGCTAGLSHEHNTKLSLNTFI